MNKEVYEKWHEPQLVQELKESFGLEGIKVDYAELENNSEKMDSLLDKFLSFKKEKMSKSHKSYGIYSYKRLSTSSQHILAEHDKKFSEFITRLEERELVLKASVSSIPPEILKTIIYNKHVLDEDRESELFGEKDPHTFAVSFGLGNVREKLVSSPMESVTYIDKDNISKNDSYYNYLLDVFNIIIPSGLDQSASIDYILNIIRETLRDDISKIIKRHAGIPATTTNAHVTGVIVDDVKNSQLGLQIYLLESLNKLHTYGNYNLVTAGKDIMVSFGYSKQCSKLIRMTDGSLIVSYATNEGNINQVNNAVSYEKVLKALEESGSSNLMSPFVIVDKVENLPPNPLAGIFLVENKAKRTKFSVQPVQLFNISELDINKSIVNDSLLKSSKSTYVDFDVNTIRNIQKYRFGFLSGEEIQKIAEERIKGHPISELVKNLEDNTAIGHVSFGISNLDDSDDRVSSIMSDISGYSLAGEILREFGVDAATVFIPLIGAIASFVEKTGGLQDNFAGDSINIIYASLNDMKTIRGENYTYTDFDKLNPAQKAFYAEIAIYTIKDNYEKKLSELLKDTNFITIANKIIGNKLGEDALNENDSILLQQLKKMLGDEKDKNIKIAMSYFYVSLIARLRGGKLDIKSLSALSDCAMELVGPTSLREAHDEGDQESAHNITNTETLKVKKFDTDRYVLEDIARKNAIVMDKDSFIKLKDTEVITDLSSSGTITDLFTLVVDEKTKKEVYVLKLEDARNSQSIKAMLSTIGIS